MTMTIMVQGSNHGCIGSVPFLLDDETNLSFDYRMQQPMATGGLIGIPPGGAPVSDLRSGNHHPAYYGHQPGPNQYYGAHLQQKYSDPILHPGQHLQIGGPVANDSPPPISAAGHGKERWEADGRYRVHSSREWQR